MRSVSTRQPGWLVAGCLVLALVILPAPRAESAGAAADTVKVSLIPAQAAWDAGDTVHVDLVVTDPGPAFNAFDAHISYDPAVLTYLPPINYRQQEGSLLTSTCPQTFHLFSVAPDSTYLTVNFSFLCPGTSVAGPGEIYRLMFIAKPVDANARFDLLVEAPTLSRFYFDGSIVEPFKPQPGIIQVGDGAAAVNDLQPAPLRLNAVPNPFNPMTVFSFELESTRSVRLEIFSLDGRRVRVLADQTVGAGPHHVTWDGRDQAGQALAAGKYIAQLRAGSMSSRHSVVLLK